MKTLAFVMLIVHYAQICNAIDLIKSSDSIFTQIGIGDEGDVLGNTMAVDGDTAMVGNKKGEVNVYTLLNENWVLTQTLGDTSLSNNDVTSISISGNMAFIGMPKLDKVIIYQKQGENWLKTQELNEITPDPVEVGFEIDPNREQNKLNFGWSISVSGDYAVIGTKHQYFNRSLSVGVGLYVSLGGYAYIYKKIEGIWIKDIALPSESNSEILSFGNRVALNHDKFLVSSKTKDDTTLLHKVHSYKLNEGIWNSTGELIPSDFSTAVLFGMSMDISGDYAIISAGHDFSDSYNNSNFNNKAYIFEFKNNTWMEKSNLMLENNREEFTTYDVKIHGRTIVMSEYDHGNISGSIHLFKNTEGENWKNFNSISKNQDRHFGWSFGIVNNQLIIGSPSDNTDSVSTELEEENSGSVYVYDISDAFLDPIYINGFE